MKPPTLVSCIYPFSYSTLPFTYLFCLNVFIITILVFKHHWGVIKMIIMRVYLSLVFILFSFFAYSGPIDSVEVKTDNGLSFYVCFEADSFRFSFPNDDSIHLYGEFVFRPMYPGKCLNLCPDENQVDTFNLIGQFWGNYSSVRKDSTFYSNVGCPNAGIGHRDPVGSFSYDLDPIMTAKPIPYNEDPAWLIPLYHYQDLKQYSPFKSKYGSLWWGDFCFMYEVPLYLLYVNTQERATFLYSPKMEIPKYHHLKKKATQDRQDRKLTFDPEVSSHVFVYQFDSVRYLSSGDSLMFLVDHIEVRNDTFIVKSFEANVKANNVQEASNYLVSNIECLLIKYDSVSLLEYDTLIIMDKQIISLKQNRFIVNPTSPKPDSDDGIVFGDQLYLDTTFSCDNNIVSSYKVINIDDPDGQYGYHYVYGFWIIGYYSVNVDFVLRQYNHHYFPRSYYRCGF